MAFARNGDCELWFETFGNPNDPTLILINGLGSQSINYPDEWCEMFAMHALHVVRFDNRDVGLSSKFDDVSLDESGAGYSARDMAGDVVAVLDHLGVARAHIHGLSMGGMIAQLVAIDFPQRVRSMTSVMSHTGEPGVGQGSPAAIELLLAAPPTDRQSFIDSWVAGLRCWGSPAFADEARWTADAQRAFDRCFHPSGPSRQFAALRAASPRVEGLRELKTPTLVIHGDRDTLIDASGGRRTAELIPNARFELIEGMGHDYPPQLWQRWTELVVRHIVAAY